MNFLDKITELYGEDATKFTVQELQDMEAASEEWSVVEVRVN